MLRTSGISSRTLSEINENQDFIQDCLMPDPGLFLPGSILPQPSSSVRTLGISCLITVATMVEEGTAIWPKTMLARYVSIGKEINHYLAKDANVRKIIILEAIRALW